MTFIVRMLRYLFWIVVVSWSVAILRRIVGNMGKGIPNSHPDLNVPSESVGRKLVHDPVCGMHLAETLAIPLREDGEVVHFCSMECRDAYLSAKKKLAASA